MEKSEAYPTIQMTRPTMEMRSERNAKGRPSGLHSPSPARGSLRVESDLRDLGTENKL